MKTPTKPRKDPPHDSPSDFAGGSTEVTDRGDPADGDFEREGRYARGSGGEGSATAAGPNAIKGAEPQVQPTAARGRRAGKPVPSTPTAHGKGKAAKRS